MWKRFPVSILRSGRRLFTTVRWNCCGGFVNSEEGLGTVVVGLMDHDACKKLIGLPEGYEVAAVIPIGYPAVEPKAGPPRKTLSEMVHCDRFGGKMF